MYDTIKRVEILEYLDATGNGPYAKWFQDLDAHAAAKVTTAPIRLSLGNTSNTKPVSAGVKELKIDFGLGYRVYFGKDGETIVILLGGGTKHRQDADIAAALERWRDYKRRKG